MYDAYTFKLYENVIFNIIVLIILHRKELSWIEV